MRSCPDTDIDPTPFTILPLWRLQRLANSKQDETKRILGVSRQTSGWDYFTGRLLG